jgi:hypothetical protein
VKYSPKTGNRKYLLRGVDFCIYPVWCYALEMVGAENWIAFKRIIDINSNMCAETWKSFTDI